MQLASIVPVLALVTLSAVASPPTRACASPIRLNEIMAGPARDWDGSGAFSSRDDEWVEIVNTGTVPVDLTGHVITDGDSIPRYAPTGVLEPGGHLLVTGKMSYDWERANGKPAFGLSLANSGDSVILWEIAGADTVPVDSYTFRSHEAAADRAIGRSPDLTGVWVLIDALNPYTGTIAPFGTGCNPTPGTANGCGQTPVRATTWGAVKRNWR